MEEYAIVSDVSVIGCVGTLIVATRGERGAGEVLLTVRGSKEAFLGLVRRTLTERHQGAGG